jgi:hypothetical protein
MSKSIEQKYSFGCIATRQIPTMVLDDKKFWLDLVVKNAALYPAGPGFES